MMKSGETQKIEGGNAPFKSRWNAHLDIALDLIGQAASATIDADWPEVRDHLLIAAGELTVAKQLIEQEK